MLLMEFDKERIKQLFIRRQRTPEVPQEPVFEAQTRQAEVTSCSFPRIGGIGIGFAGDQPPMLITYAPKRKLGERELPGVFMLDAFTENAGTRQGSYVIREDGTTKKDGQIPPSEDIVRQLPDILRSIDPSIVSVDPNWGWNNDEEPRRQYLTHHADTLETYLRSKDERESHDETSE